MLLIAGCATLNGRDPVRMHVVGIEPIAGQGMEARFNLKLRVQNPNDVPIDYDGIALELDLNDREFASGVSADKGSVPRFGERVISVPISVSALNALRQGVAAFGGDSAKGVPYVLRAKFGGPLFAGLHFKESGTLDLTQLGTPE